MSVFANRLTRGLEPYVPGEQPKEQGLIKLNTNENPFPPGPLTARALKDFDPGRLRLYPDPESKKLREKLAADKGLDYKQVFVGNGSDEVLAFVFQTFFETEGEPLLFPERTYSFYEVYAKRYGIPFERIALRENESVCVKDYDRAGQAVILANPNAPSGRLLQPEEIAALCAQNPKRPVFVDEAYIDFAPPGSSAAALLSEFPNLMVIQTFSKSRSLAGLRVGMAFAAEEMIADLFKQKDCFNSYPLDRLATELALAALEEPGYYRRNCRLIIKQREKTAAGLKELGFEVTDSAANFLWIRHPRLSGGDLYRELRSRRILVRHWDKEGLRDYLRVTIGTEEEMGVFLRALRDIAEDNKEN